MQDTSGSSSHIAGNIDKNKCVDIKRKFDKEIPIKQNILKSVNYNLQVCLNSLLYNTLCLKFFYYVLICK